MVLKKIGQKPIALYLKEFTMMRSEESIAALM